MKALTVRQPYAELIAAGHKTIENRPQGTRHRGPLAIHAGISWSHYGQVDPQVVQALGREPRDPDPDMVRGLIIAVADLIDVHLADGTCCTPWGWHQSAPSIRAVKPMRHLVLADVRRLAVPFPATGRLGLWDIDDAQIEAALPEAVTP